MTNALPPPPTISVVIEGYNESREQGKADNTIQALLHQDFPLDQVELILVGSSSQVEEWRHRSENPRPFHSVKAVPADGARYYELKNQGAQFATAEIIAFTDSDVYPVPTWVSAIVANIRRGADVSVGLSLFKDARRWSATSLPRQMAVSCAFGYILGPINEGEAQVRGFMDHNVALRAEVFRQTTYRTEFGRIIASPLLFRKLKDGGFNIRFAAQQAITHYFGWRYWLRNIQFRYGYEVHRLRRLDPGYPNQWIRRTGVFEPVVTMGWHMLLDVPRWFRFSRMRGRSPLAAWLSLPALVAVSGLARAAEMAGMYATMISPEAMRRWSESV